MTLCGFETLLLKFVWGIKKTVDRLLRGCWAMKSWLDFIIVYGTQMLYSAVITMG